eukprot:CAMPEP_0203840768 /NCGR_PEP_ID=MMETSP0359-20131031/967_1 /ASSEMBLY_ACC=CAM_ASM_000338 /TAXON_ID=268821 /ORGANISM="Scrippsiella Hangoei, Strain SHTV-5" /LENGTH=755 /DNA_ID=CAMNT_0050755029 /DNA_START=50 /DNA_END=2317 /DNA_ORIENTATION=+
MRVLPVWGTFTLQVVFVLFQLGAADDTAGISPAVEITAAPDSHSGEDAEVGLGNSEKGVNSNPNCHAWAERGECGTNSVYMLKHCSRSCTVHETGQLDEETACSSDAIAAGTCKAPAPSVQGIHITDTDDVQEIESESGVDDSERMGDQQFVFSETSAQDSLQSEEHSQEPTEDLEGRLEHPETQLAQPQNSDAMYPSDKEVSPNEDVPPSSTALEHSPVIGETMRQEVGDSADRSSSQELPVRHQPDLASADAPPVVTSTSGGTDRRWEQDTQVKHELGNIAGTAGAMPDSTVAEWKSRVVAVYSIVQILGQWVSAVAAEATALSMNFALVEPPLNAILLIFLLLITTLGFFRTLPTGRGQPQNIVKQSAASQMSAIPANPNQEGHGVEALRRQFEMLQKQQEQTAAELRRCIQESASNFMKCSSEIQELRRERSSTDEEICESLKEIFDWMGGSGAPELINNGASKSGSIENDSGFVATAELLPQKGAQSGMCTDDAPGTVYSLPVAVASMSISAGNTSRNVQNVDSKVDGPVSESRDVGELQPAEVPLLHDARVPPATACAGDPPSSSTPAPAPAVTMPMPAAPPWATAQGMHPESAHAQQQAQAATLPFVPPSPQAMPQAAVPQSVSQKVDGVPAAAAIHAASAAVAAAAEAAVANAAAMGATPADADAAPDSAAFALTASIGGVRPQLQDIKATSNPYGSRPQQQPIAAAANPFGSRPKHQPVQANVNPFGSRPQQQPVQASSNPFGASR